MKRGRTHHEREFRSIGDRFVDCNEHCPSRNLGEKTSNITMAHPVLGINAESQTWGNLAPICNARGVPPPKLDLKDSLIYLSTGSRPNKPGGFIQARVCLPHAKGKEIEVTKTEV